MKSCFTALSLVLLSSFALFGQNEMVIEGTYQGENLFVQNPFASSGVGFCVIDVTINGDQSIDEINSSAFEIDFTSYQLTKGQSVRVKIEYKDDCSPRVLNPEVLKASSTFVIVSSDVDKDGLITWTTSGESGPLPFIVEQFRWNKWVKVGEVKGKGLAGNNSYSFKASPHSGPNKFRLKQVDHTKKARYSKDIRLIRSNAPEVVITNDDKGKIKDAITFGTPDGASAATMYEIVNSYGVLVKKGVGSSVDVSSMPEGDYWISYDNKVESFSKK